MTAAIWKIVISPYLSCESSELHEILYADTNFTAGDGNDKNQKLANSKWRMDAVLKIIFGYNSAACCPIKMKFGVRRQNHTHTKQVK